ncbi:FecR family protein [Pedobacter sp. GR22-6]|uniref:FecR family protein n=1 Tax=Pedobacter sp. GR22-6 TaxID=3127957 RepID=UPI00307D8E77
MKQIPEHIAHLLFLHLNDALKPEQQIVFDRWLSESPYNEAILDRAQKENLSEELKRLKSIDKEKGWGKLLQAIGEKQIPRSQSRMQKVKFRMFVGWATAAVLFLCLSYFIYQDLLPKTVSKVLSGDISMDLKPGTQGAVLTLSNGQKVLLDSLKSGEVTVIQGQKAKLVNGVLAYESGAGAPVFNVVSTPNSRQYHLILPDGTKVWLNSASSIRFPTRFVSGERRVEVSGEAYFEVMKDSRQPFRIITRDKVEVLVLGTHFNLNSYENEAKVSTTLLEGSVRVQHNTDEVTIRPGQQAQVSTLNSQGKSSIRTFNDVNLEKAIAWKNGLFNFEGAELQEVMRQLERWYGIEVRYEGLVPKVKFFGEISRNENLSDVLKALEESHIHFRLEAERRLIVLAN